MGKEEANMARISIASIMCAVFVALLCLTLSIQVGAADIFVRESAGCVGRGYTFMNIPSKKCAVATGRSVLVVNVSSCHLSGVFEGGSCTNQTVGTYGNVCFTLSNANVTGAAWENRCKSSTTLRGRQLLSSKRQGSEGCDMLPSGVSFTDDLGESTWVLESSTDQATQDFSDLGNVPLAERAEWLKAKGARLLPPPSNVKHEQLLSNQPVLPSNEVDMGW